MTRSGKRCYCRVSTPSHSPASGLSKLIGTVFLSSACGHHKESTCFITWWFRDTAAKLITPTFFADGHCNILPSLIAGRLTRPSPSQASDRPAISNGTGPSKLSWDSGSAGISIGFRGLIEQLWGQNLRYIYQIETILKKVQHELHVFTSCTTPHHLFTPLTHPPATVPLRALWWVGMWPKPGRRDVPKTWVGKE